jgi:hypothetical protein
MKRAKEIPQIDGISRRKWNHVKEWSSGPWPCIQHFIGHFTGAEQLAKPKFSACCPKRV